MKTTNKNSGLFKHTFFAYQHGKLITSHFSKRDLLISALLELKVRGDKKSFRDFDTWTIADLESVATYNQIIIDTINI